VPLKKGKKGLNKKAADEDSDDSDVSEDSEARIDAANAMLDDLEQKNKEENSDDEDMEESKLKKFG